MNTRRGFVKKSVAGLFAANMISVPEKSEAGSVVKKTPDTFNLAMAGYSFVHFNLDQSLEMMKKTDVHYLCIKDFHLPLNSTPEQIQAFHAKLKEADVKGYAVGPIYTKTTADIDNAFEYAKKVGVKLIVGIPAHADLKYVEKKVKEYDIKFAIHNHGPEDKLYPNAASVYKLVKDLDERVGLCFDMGHNQRDNQDPSNDLWKYSKRIFDIHLKNVTAANKDGKTCELGRGIIDISLFVKMLRKIKYAGACSLEYEKDMKDPLAGIAESVGYFRGVCDAG
ncbi:sugar phosphate isomerase/epimerase family protein [Dyadobacter sediminis]|uniref:Sugar phosphate isomerase/epimerase n=1 Tax=Dyadobacter sediminis TaxID=1493691 RepID=A0A5R9KKQ8_9BACT|nr:sugar phosphate isomerase/epimerase family protein [Dyadobacter sediminis]TLU96793.1 sugar phosphate isomerase/epimerase [Dyadobacter sediminis]GGB85202.1 sugar phosphate isomerase/epimerase IoIE [Dyadobacter sediminis]